MSDSLATWKSMTHDRAAQIARWIGWIFICIGLGGGFGLIAYDWVLR